MPRSSEAVITPNKVFTAARRRLPSPCRAGQYISRPELADVVNRALDRLYPGAELASLYVNPRWVGKLERGESRWPVEERRAALREVFSVEADIDLGLYSPRRTDPVEADHSMIVADVRNASPAQFEAPETGGSVSYVLKVDAGRGLRQKAFEMDRRRFLSSSALGLGLGMAGRSGRFPRSSEDWQPHAPMADSATFTVDEIDRFYAVLQDARRYTDAALVHHLGGALARSARDDGSRGPFYALPSVMGVVALVRHAAHEAKPRVRNSLLAVGARAAELAGWLYRDCGQPSAAEYWRDRASEWAMESADFAMPGYILVKKSQSAWDDRDAARMLGLAQAAQKGPWTLPARVMAEAVQQQARGLAMMKSSQRVVDDTLKRARELLDDSAQEQTPLAAHYDASLFRTQIAICYAESDRPEKAVEIYKSTLTPSIFSTRDYAYFMTLKAQTLVAVSQPDDAALAGAAALQGAFAAGSARTVREVLRLRNCLEPWRGREAVDDFIQLVESVT